MHEIGSRRLTCQRVRWWGGAGAGTGGHGRGRGPAGGGSVGRDFGQSSLLHDPSFGRFEEVGGVGHQGKAIAFVVGTLSIG